MDCALEDLRQCNLNTVHSDRWEGTGNCTTLYSSKLGLYGKVQHSV